ncbi:hypothetical protein QYE76_049745 [Lolium multiflorum]|uniref:CCHC-type domain-containing protein n=1 Tax=Lolium multiflorum TaxID=4521 RepID=A0AAD8WH63_LOLMU|nr:hypothetical protein QYE76_049745 [Lolium multiflorum]
MSTPGAEFIIGTGNIGHIRANDVPTPRGCSISGGSRPGDDCGVRCGRSNGGDLRCYKCGEKGHIFMDCTKGGRSCYKCGEAGHISSHERQVGGSIRGRRLLLQLPLQLLPPPTQPAQRKLLPPLLPSRLQPVLGYLLPPPPRLQEVQPIRLLERHPVLLLMAPPLRLPPLSLRLPPRLPQHPRRLLALLLARVVGIYDRHYRRLLPRLVLRELRVCLHLFYGRL